MDVEELSMVGPVVDLASVDSIHRKRIVAFVNHFIVHTSKFLNQLSSTIESKLLGINLRLQKLEAAIILLECKLNSIPKLNEAIPVSESSTQKSEGVPAVQEIATLEPAPTTAVNEVDGALVNNEAFNEEDNQAVKEEDNELIESVSKYVKMLHVGVPMPAVKLKMQQDGLSSEQQNYVLSL